MSIDSSGDLRAVPDNLTLFAEFGSDLPQLAASDDIIQAVGPKIGRYLGIATCSCIEVDEQGHVTASYGWARADAAHAELPTPSVDEFLRDYFRPTTRAAGVVVVSDTQTDARTSTRARAVPEVRALLGVPFHRHGRLRYVLAVTDARPREWQPHEIVLLEQIASIVFPRLERAHAEEALRQTQDLFRIVIDSVKDYAIMTLDRDGRVTSWNDGAQRLKQYTRDEILGRHVTTFYPPDLVECGEAEGEMRDAREYGHSEREGWRIRKDGSRFWVNEIMTPLHAADGTHLGYTKISRDLTERRQAEEALRRSEEHLRLLIESVHDYAIFTMAPDGAITSWNPGAQRMFGYTEAEAIGQHTRIIFAPEDRLRGTAEDEFEQALKTGRAADERWHVDKDGARFWVSGVLTPIVQDGEVLSFVKVARDLTQRKGLQDALQHAHDDLEQRVQARTSELAAIMRRLVTVQEEERRRIARDLHDDIGQQMTALHLKLEALRTRVQGEAVERLLRDTQDFVLDLDRRVRVFAGELRSSALYTLGLIPALEDLADTFQDTYALPVTVEVVGARDTRLASVLEINLYRIAQEALQNAHKHANARQVDLFVQQAHDRIVLTVTDDGRGFDLEAMAKDSHRGLGLIGMTERAALIGGRLEIETHPGAGTSILVSAPVVHESDR